MHSESSSATGHLSCRPEPSLALKPAIARASPSPAGTWSLRLSDTAFPTTHRLWEGPQFSSREREGLCIVGGSSQPSRKRNDFPEYEYSKGEKVCSMDSNLGLSLSPAPCRMHGLETSLFLEIQYLQPERNNSLLLPPQTIMGIIGRKMGFSGPKQSCWGEDCFLGAVGYAPIHTFIIYGRE